VIEPVVVSENANGDGDKDKKEVVEAEVAGTTMTSTMISNESTNENGLPE